MSSLVLGAALSWSATARADLETVHTAHASGNDVGIGLMVGVTSGVSAKIYATERVAFALGLGSSHDDFDYHTHGFSVQGDVLWHPAVLARNHNLALPLYLGLGTRLGGHEHPGDEMDDHFVMGARAPVGLALEFVEFPADIFAEVVPSLDFIGPGHGGDFYVGGALGARYFF